MKRAIIKYSPIRINEYTSKGVKYRSYYYDYFCKPITRNDTLNIQKYKVKSISIYRNRYFGQDNVKYMGIDFDSSGSVIPDSGMTPANTYPLYKSKRIFKFNKEGNPIKLDYSDSLNDRHNICRYIYDSKGNIIEMKIKAFKRFYEGDITNIKYEYDKRGLLVKEDHYYGVYETTEPDYILTYFYEFYK